jgi:hypothetical protein
MLTKALELAAQITHPVTAAIFAAVIFLFYREPGAPCSRS